MTTPAITRRDLRAARWLLLTPWAVLLALLALAAIVPPPADPDATPDREAAADARAG